MTIFTGIWVPLATPFRHGQIDFPALSALARRLADAGVSGLVACGSTGEAAALDENEQLAVLDAIIDAVPHCPVAMGLGGINLAAMLAMQHKIQSRRIAGLLVAPPYYIRPSQQGIIAHFNTIADAASVPLAIYNIPYRTGATMTLDTIRIIAQHPRVAAIKDCGGDAITTMSLIADGKIAVLSGEDHHILANLCLGGAGAFAASAHIRPDLFIKLVHLVQIRDLPAARTLFYQLLPLIQLLFSEPNPAPLKTVLAQAGLLHDELRAPMQRTSLVLTERLSQLMMETAQL